MQPSHRFSNDNRCSFHICLCGTSSHTKTDTFGCFLLCKPHPPKHMRRFGDARCACRTCRCCHARLDALQYILSVDAHKPNIRVCRMCGHICRCNQCDLCSLPLKPINKSVSKQPQSLMFGRHVVIQNPSGLPTEVLTSSRKKTRASTRKPGA